MKKIIILSAAVMLASTGVAHAGKDLGKGKDWDHGKDVGHSKGWKGSKGKGKGKGKGHYSHGKGKGYGHGGGITSPVPEASTLALMSAGFGIVGLVAYRRRKQA
jgi:hypothetical protein